MVSLLLAAPRPAPASAPTPAAPSTAPPPSPYTTLPTTPPAPPSFGQTPPSSSAGALGGRTAPRPAAPPQLAGDLDGWLPLHWAAYYGDGDVAALLLEAGHAAEQVRVIKGRHRNRCERSGAGTTACTKAIIRH